jgi:hypothetical protein
MNRSLSTVLVGFENQASTSRRSLIITVTEQFNSIATGRLTVIWGTTLRKKARPPQAAQVNQKICV